MLQHQTSVCARCWYFVTSNKNAAWEGSRILDWRQC